MKYFLIFIILFFLLPLQARKVNLEWDEIETAKSYEIQLTRGKNKISKKTNVAKWSGELEPGIYSLTIRAFDHRKVPSEWSEPKPITIGIDKPKLISPEVAQTIKGKDAKETRVHFKWTKISQAKKYLLEVSSKTDSFKKSLDTKDTETDLKLKTAEEYTWAVTAVSENSDLNSNRVESSFTVKGPKLAPPKIEKPENEFVRKLQWDQPEFATSYSVTIQRKDSKTNKWSDVYKKNPLADQSVDFAESLPGGKYRIAVSSQAPLRESSLLRIREFNVRIGDRSPATEYNTEIRKSIDRNDGWYAVASYLQTQVQFSTKNYDQNILTTFQTSGASARIGAGYWRGNSSWGFLGLLDYSSFNQDGTNVSYMSSEFSAVWRRNIGEQQELRISLGLATKQLPILSGDPRTQQLNSNSKIHAYGPQVGFEYWIPISPKFGLQANGKIYDMLGTISTPNNQSIVAANSFQVGLLGSYRITQRWTGLLGITHREELLKYHSQAINPKFIGNDNEAQVKGDFFSLMTEYNF